MEKNCFVYVCERLSMGVWVCECGEPKFDENRGNALTSFLQRIRGIHKWKYLLGGSFRLRIIISKFQRTAENVLLKGPSYNVDASHP